MKKFMKAIAFVTVMCMALSTVAFAEGVTPVLRQDAKILDITVTGAGNDQVALVVVPEGEKDFSKALYIDQKASASDTVTFEAVLTNTTATVADVYVGYAALENGPAFVGGVKLTEDVTEVTIAKLDTEIVQGTEDLIGAQQVGAGVAIELEVEAPENVAATKMIWAIRYTENGDPKVKYSNPIPASEYNLGSVVEGSVTLGLAFLNGFNRAGEEIASVVITDVDVIILFEGEVDGAPYSETFFTDETGEDKDNKKKTVNETN